MSVWLLYVCQCALVYVCSLNKIDIYPVEQIRHRECERSERKSVRERDCGRRDERLRGRGRVSERMSEKQWKEGRKK